MKIIYEMHPLIRKLLPNTAPLPGISYRPIAFCVQLDVPEGLLIYHTLTKAVYLLDAEEKNALNETFPQSPTALHLVQDFFLVPQEHDDCRLADEINQFITSIDNQMIDGKLNNYTILPTTNCNARCYYCYEAGCKAVDMTEETAHQVAAYILKTARSNQVNINWFGGEPLCHPEAIDLICQDLKAGGLTYYSHITSNAYLFDAEMIRKATQEWNLKNIQVTLDGTEQVYNTVKAYIDPEPGSPFQRVLQNILMLLEADVFVVIRLNMSEENYNDLEQLSDQLLSILPQDKRYRIYAHLLFDLEQDADLERRAQLIRLEQKLNEHIFGKSAISRSRLKLDVRFWRCQATDGASIVIDPEGNLYPCEHFNQCASCGTIYHDEQKFRTITNWQKPWKQPEDCKTCICYPNCGRIELCPANPKSCIPAMREQLIAQIIDSLRYEWEVLSAKGDAEK